MAFAIRNLSVLAYANGFTLWHYKSGKDRLTQVEKADFFADAADMLAEGDMMHGLGAGRRPHSDCRRRLRPARSPLRGWSDRSPWRDRLLQYIPAVPQRSRLGERVSSVLPRNGKAQAGKPRQAGTVLRSRWSSDISAQHQPVQR